MSTRKFLPWKTGEKKVAEYHSYVSKSNILNLCFNNRRESAAKKGYLKKYDIIPKLTAIKGLTHRVFVLQFFCVERE